MRSSSNLRTSSIFLFSLLSEVLGLIPQSVLLTYLKVVLTEWEEPKESLERAAVILPQITNVKLIQELLSSLLSTIVSEQIILLVSVHLTFRGVNPIN